jgi:hypothetical protein
MHLATTNSGRVRPLTTADRQEVMARVFKRRRTARCQRTLRIGSPGSWKSGASEVEAIQWWIPPFERRALLYLDPHGTTVQSLARRFWSAGRGNRFVLDDLSETRRVPAYKVFGDTRGDGFAAELKVHDEAMRQVEILADERGHMERVNVHPFIRQWLYWPIRAVIRDRAPMRVPVHVRRLEDAPGTRRAGGRAESEASEYDRGDGFKQSETRDSSHPTFD